MGKETQQAKVNEKPDKVKDAKDSVQNGIQKKEKLTGNYDFLNKVLAKNAKKAETNAANKNKAIDDAHLARIKEEKDKKYEKTYNDVYKTN